jgi:type IV secretion system protein VirD4
MAFPFFSRRETVIGSDAPDAFYLGRYRDEKTGRVGPKLQMPGNEPIIIIGRNRSGKDAGIGNYNGLRLEGKSVVFLDNRGEARAVCGPYRSTLGPTYNINPFGLLTNIPGYEDCRSDGWGALARLKAQDPMLFEETTGIAEAMHKLEGKDPHWSLRSRGASGGLSMNEVIDASKTGRPALLANVRDALTEGTEYDPQTHEPITGMVATARRLVKEGHPQIKSLLGNFTEDNDETRSVLATADGQTQFLLSQPIRDDELKNGVPPLDELGQKPISLFVMMPSEMVQADSIHSVYLRLIISSALRSLYRPSPVACTFYLNEFPSLGRLQPIEAALGLVAGSGIQLVIVVQSLTQLAQTYETTGWENFFGQAGAVVLVGPPADKFTAEYLAPRAGEMTIRQPNVGMTLNPGGIGLSNGEAYTRRQYLMPMDLYGLQPGYGYVWVAGLSNAIPAYFPPFFDVDQLNRRARANPYYRG